MKIEFLTQFYCSDNIQNSITEALYTCGNDTIAANMVTASTVAIIFAGAMLQHRTKICSLYTAHWRLLVTKYV
jgi:hypothetical protein